MPSTEPTGIQSVAQWFPTEVNRHTYKFVGTYVAPKYKSTDAVARKNCDLKSPDNTVSPRFKWSKVKPTARSVGLVADWSMYLKVLVVRT